jgi:hypothetical protein
MIREHPINKTFTQPDSLDKADNSHLWFQLGLRLSICAICTLYIWEVRQFAQMPAAQCTPNLRRPACAIWRTFAESVQLAAKHSACQPEQGERRRARRPCSFSSASWRSCISRTSRTPGLVRRRSAVSS